MLLLCRVIANFIGYLIRVSVYVQRNYTLYVYLGTRIDIETHTVFVVDPHAS